LKLVSPAFHHRLLFLAAMLILPIGAALAGPGPGPGPGHGTGSPSAFSSGAAGKEADVTRTVTVVMRDTLFNKREIEIRPGETVRFILKNKGEFLHEFNIGSSYSHAKHQKEMIQMMEMGMLTPTGVDGAKMNMPRGGIGNLPMVHADANSVLVKPGETKELTWKFIKFPNLEFACNLPGHYQAGMVGRFKVKG